MPNEFRGYRNNAIRRTIGLIKGAAEQPTEPVSDSGRNRSIIGNKDYHHGQLVDRTPFIDRRRQ
jgi:hypothetical protein